MSIGRVGYNTSDLLQSAKVNEVILALNNLTYTDNFLTVVRQKSDLPTPIDGVISLNDYGTYYFVAEVDLEGDRLLAGINSVILGTSSENAKIYSTGLTSEALISSQYSLPIRNISLEAAILFDLDGDGVTTAIDWQAVNIVNTPNIGRVADYSNVIMQDSAIINSSNWLFDGVIGTVGFNGCLFQPNSGQTCLLTTSTTNITRRFRIIYSAIIVPPVVDTSGVYIDPATTLLSESYILDTVNFAGGGDYLTGLDHTSNKSLFVNCVGIENTANRGFMFCVNNSSATVVTVQDAWGKATIPTSAGATNSKFSHSTNRLTYEGAFTQSFNIAVNTSMSTDQPNQVLSIAIAKNGVVITDTEMTVRANTSNQVYPISTGYALTLAPTDYIELFVKNNTGTSDITIEDFNLGITKIPA